MERVLRKPVSQYGKGSLKAGADGWMTVGVPAWRPSKSRALEDGHKVAKQRERDRWEWGGGGEGNSQEKEQHLERPRSQRAQDACEEWMRSQGGWHTAYMKDSSLYLAEATGRSEADMWHGQTCVFRSTLACGETRD